MVSTACREKGVAGLTVLQAAPRAVGWGFDWRVGASGFRV